MQKMLQPICSDHKAISRLSAAMILNILTRYWWICLWWSYTIGVPLLLVPLSVGVMNDFGRFFGTSC